MRSDVRWNRLTTGVRVEAKLSASISGKRQVACFRKEDNLSQPPSMERRRVMTIHREKPETIGEREVFVQQTVAIEAREFTGNIACSPANPSAHQCIPLKWHRDVLIGNPMNHDADALRMYQFLQSKRHPGAHMMNSGNRSSLSADTGSCAVVSKAGRRRRVPAPPSVAGDGQVSGAAVNLASVSCRPYRHVVRGAELTPFARVRAAVRVTANCGVTNARP